MTEIAHSINFDLPEKLKDRNYRTEFFWAETSAEIAGSLVRIRKLRGLNQKQLAEEVGTKQSAISRVEQADYQNWNVKTLRSIAGALDARVRVIIEPAEDVLSEYDESDDAPVADAGAPHPVDRRLASQLLVTVPMPPKRG